MRYFRTILSAVFLCMAATLCAQTNVLRVSEVTYPAGKTLSLPIELNISSDIVGVQFDLSVPFELATNEEGAISATLTNTRVSNHKLISTKTNTEWRDPEQHGGIDEYHNYRFIVYSENNSKLSGSMGTFITVDIPLPENLDNGTVFPVYLIDKSVILSNREKQNMLTTQQDGSITIEVVPRPDLQPSEVKVSQTLVEPGGELDFSWKVSNIGDLATGAGWTERLFLESQTTGNRVYVGTSAYEGTLAIDGSVNRSAHITLDDFPGISGKCRPVVQIIPAAGCGEIALNQGNNTAFGNGYALRVNKYLVLTANKNLIPKNVNEGYYCELRRTGDVTEAQTFNITSCDAAGQTDRLSFSDNGRVTFAKGANRTGFYVYPVNNDRFDVDERVAVIVNEALNNGYDKVIDSVRIEETNQVRLTLRTDKDTYNEGDTIRLTASVPQRPFPGQLAVYLNIEEQQRFKLPQRIVFAEGALEATVNIPILQDKSPANDQSIRISGTAEHYNNAEALFLLYDDDTPAIQMTLAPTTVSEGAGPQAIMGTITRTGVTNNKITIQLADDGVNDIYYSQQTLTMPAGTTTVKFPLGVQDNQVVDGDRKVRIRAAVYMTDCNCSAIGDKQAVVTDSIIITDDDGPTLSIIADRSAIMEGDEEGCSLTISRNTETTEALTVTIETDAADVEFEKTAVIPAGQKSVKVSFRALENDSREGDRTISVVAKATGFSAGSTWLLISDRTMPDLTITEFEITPTTVNESTRIQARVKVKNIGSAGVPANIPIKLYYDDREWTTYTTTKPIGKGQTEEFWFTPYFLSTGTFSVKAVVNPNNKPVELLTTNNTSEIVELTGNSLYNYTLKPKKAGVNNREGLVEFTGTCIGVDGKVNQRHYFCCFMECGDQRVHVGVVGGINKDGSFYANAYMPTSFYGTVKIGACPTNDEAISKNYLGSFEVYGMERTENSYIVNELFIDEPQKVTIRIKNSCGLDLHNVTASITDEYPRNARNNYEIQVKPIDVLPAHGEADLEYTITGKKTTSIDDYEQLVLTLQSEELTQLVINTWNYTKMRSADLAVSEDNIQTTAQITQPRTYPIWLTNKGENSTGKIHITLPGGMGKFVTLASAADIPSLERGDSTMILLKFDSRGFDVNVEQTGTIAINCENGNGTVIHFSVTTVSESKGDLKVYVQDEMTIYGDKDGNHPRVNEATVVLKDYNTGADIKTLTTDASGYVTFEDVNEGFYQLYVTAPKHDNYRQNILVAPGKTTTHTATISYQAIAVTWDVVETEVEDEYQIVSTLTYETQVPVPVIVMTAPDTLALDLIEPGKSTMYNVVLRNEGLIAAQNTKLTLPEAPGYTFTPLVQYEGVVVAAQQSYVIPIRVTRDEDTEDPAESRGTFKPRRASSAPCNGRYLADFEWPCGNDHKHAWVAKGVNLIKNALSGGCSHDWTGTYGNGGGWGEPPLRNGGGWNIKPASYGHLRGTVDLLCAMSNLVPDPDGLNDKLDQLNDILEILQNGGDWEDIKNAIKNEGNRRLEGAQKDIKDALTDGLYSKVEDWKNFYNGVRNVYDGVGNGDYLVRSFRAPEDESSSTEEEEIDPATVEGTVEYYQNILEEYVDNPYFRTYLTKMNLYAIMKLTYNSLIEELLNAPEALEHYTPEFDVCIDSLNNIVRDMMEGMVVYTGSFFAPNINISGGKTIEEMQDRINAVKINGSDRYYDFDYEQYVKRSLFYCQRLLGYRHHVYQVRLYNAGTHTEGAKTPMDEVDFRDGGWYSYVGTNYVRNWYPRDTIIRYRYLKEYTTRLDSCQNDLILKGFSSWDELYASAQQDLLDMYKNLGKNTCATVKLEISQEMVMTRQAFRGMLTMENGLSQDITDIELSLLVKDLMGNKATSHEFQINFESIEGFEGSVEGPWTLGPGAKGVATILFIPTKYAAPEALTTWSFGGTLYFNDGEGATQVRQLLPVQLQVKPSPVLDLTYFMQRDVYGDNPLTKDVIEPMVPAEFAVLINNKGKGDATNIRMFTRQPEIIDNEKGLFIDFNIISSSLNDGETVLALDSTITTNFGDIEAGKSAWARWDLTASLLGHFNKYDVSVNHVTSYGNPDLSLLDQVSIHELIHSIKIPKYTMSVPHGYTQYEDLRGWAVNDGLGENPDELPDRMYLSDGTSYPIINLTDRTTIKYVGTDSYAYDIYFSDYSDLLTDVGDRYFVYTSFTDPTMGGGGIKAIDFGYWVDRMRDVSNQWVWQTQYTMRDGADPIRDNRVHMLLPNVQNVGMRRITFEPTPKNRLAVKSIETVPQGDAIATDVLDELTVIFNKPVNDSTFTRNDMVLRYEGEKLSNDIQITKAADNDSVFTVKMQGVDRNGYYTLLVNSDGVKDQEGYAGMNGKQVGWMLFKGGLVQYNVEPWPSLQAGDIATSSEETNGEISYGTNITMTATPAEGYTFDYWGTVDESIESASSARARVQSKAPSAILENQITRYSNENPVSVPMNRSRNMRAVFKPTNCTVTIVCDERQGSVNTTSAVYDYGTVLNLHAEAKDGYTFVGYSDGETTLSTDADYEYTVTAPVTLTTLFKSTAPESILLRESIDYTPVSVAYANVRLQRSFNKNQWNTLCIPTDISNPANVFGADTRVAQLEGIDGETVMFTTVSSIEANVPYLIQSGTTNSNGTIQNGSTLQSIYSIRETELKVPTAGLTLEHGGVEMTGTYEDIDLPTDNGYYSLDHEVLVLAKDTATVTSGRFRAFFHIPESTVETLYIAIDGIATGISLHSVNEYGDLYTLSGVLVQHKAKIKSLLQQGKLKPGIYIMNGRKVIVR
ncbi:MAG: Ig-like domain-containing protein [Bacteroidaceae bacterium]|nr:Ig-like domain-containing protein [Bacteroidaceae bacterium]